MTNEEREKSYERYKQWQYNKIRYRKESIAYGFIFGVILLFVLANLKATIIVLVMYAAGAYIYGKIKEKKSREKLQEIALEMGLEIESIDSNGRIIANIPKDKSEKIITDLKKKAGNEGIKINIQKQAVDQINMENMNKEQAEYQSQNKELTAKKNKGTTQNGFVNDNLQRNNGKTEHRGTDHGQWFYDMECLKCGHRYYANGSDIWRRKCPNCQGGRP